MGVKIRYDPNSPVLVADSEGFVVGMAMKWNLCDLGEIIVQYFDGSADSAFASELNFPNGREQAYEILNRQER